MYFSEEACKKGLLEFRELIKNNDGASLLNIEIGSDNKYFVLIKNKDDILFRRNLGYVHKKDCYSWITRIINHIDAELK